MSGSLTSDLSAGYRQVQEVLSDRERADLARARDPLMQSRSQRGRSLLALVQLYRVGPRQLWAPVLLDLLAPAMLHRLRRLRDEPPVMVEEDIRQQLVLELLHAAAMMPLPNNPAHLKAALLHRANQGVRRKLAREHGRQRRQRSYDAMVEERS